MDPSVVLLAIGLLCGLWDQLFGVRKWPGNSERFSERARFSWAERRLTIVASLLALAAIVLQVLGH